MDEALNGRMTDLLADNCKQITKDVHLFRNHLFNLKSEPEHSRDTSVLNEKYQIMKKGDLLEYVKILSKDKK